MVLEFRAKNASFAVDIPSEVSEAMDTVRDFLGAAGAQESTESEWACVVDCNRLQASLRNLKTHFQEHSETIPYIYRTSFVNPYTSRRSDGSGAIHGFRIKGVICTLWAGYDKCILERRKRMPDGTGKVVSREDVRHLEYLDSDDWGRIHISKRRATSAVVKWINSISRKLKTIEGDVVVELA